MPSNPRKLTHYGGRALIEKSEESLEAQISEREDSVDAYFDGLRDLEEIPRPQKMVEEACEPHPLSIEAEWRNHACPG